MLNHIIKLLEATLNLKVSYRQSGTEMGVRGYNMYQGVNGICYQGCCDDTVLIDGICWTIYGDIYDKRLNERIRDLRTMRDLERSAMFVHVKAQTSIAGITITVDLGKRSVCGRYALENGEGVLDLA